MSDITFESFDKFHRKEFADSLTKVIKKFYPFYNEAFVLGLNGRYGSGKTTFLQMWRHELEKQGVKVIYINAWETDFDNEPLLPIISAFLDNIKDDEDRGNIKQALKGALGVWALAGNNLLDHATGINVYEIVKEVESNIEEEDIQNIGEGLYKGYSFKKDAYKTLKEKLSRYVEELENKPLVVFVDELDRVRPNYSVQFLEAIKHIFAVKGICFVLAVDRQQLECSIKQLYGSIDFENYYRRFITREAHLPEYMNFDLIPFINYLSGNFFDEKRASGIQFAFAQKNQAEVLQFIATVCRAYHLAPRQIKSFFRVFSQFMAIESDRTHNIEQIKASIILIAILTHDPSLYNEIGREKITVRNLYEHMMSLDFSYPEHNYDQKYVLSTALACYMKSSDKSKLDEIANFYLSYEGEDLNAENSNEKRKNAIGMLARSVSRIGVVPEVSMFKRIYTLLEEWRPFLESRS